MKHKAKSGPSPTKSGGKGGGSTKGKGKGGGAAGGPTFELADVPLSLPDFTPASASAHEAWVPRYHALLKREEGGSAGVGLGVEEVDTLQLELEAMLTSTRVRRNAIQHELQLVTHLEKHKGEAKGRKVGPASVLGREGGPRLADITSRGWRAGWRAGGRASGLSPALASPLPAPPEPEAKPAWAESGPSSPGKRGASHSLSREGSKRFKSAGKPTGEKSNQLIALPKIKNEANVPTFDPLQNEQIRPLAESAKPVMPKNETPNRFWSFVEPYCAPITPEDIKLLEDLIKTHGDMAEYHKIPSLGQHYTQTWAKEDMENERQKGAGTMAHASEANGDTKPNVDDLVVKSEPAGHGDETPFGELTQRLVAGLMEENIMTSVDDSMEAAKKAGQENPDLNKTGLIRSLNINNADSLEARVRKELEEQGLLDSNEDESAPEDDNDEILEEMKRCQNELKAVSTHNLGQLKRLLKCAKEEMVRQELRNRLQKADEDVMEAYQRISTSRSKKKSPSKKEREQAWKALKEREIILKELESV
eukprot:maker-scaffold190_size271632-snap-gene-0.23 protein:Tk12371 transcript:maker-scaffold190_size271632-snap-gene-0.23-mRNA-1 annotation:"hypothetical protein CAPTEDRAFT_174003"